MTDEGTCFDGRRALGNCEGVGLVKRVHTLFGEVHRLATALKEVEEELEEVQEIKMNGKMRRMKRMEDSKSKRNAHHMRG